MKFCETCGCHIETLDGDNQCKACDLIEQNEKRRARAREAKREREQALKDLGLVKVRGALGGTYWE